MSSKHTLSLGITEAQHAAFEQARQRAGLSASAAKEQAIKQFCVSQGIAWPIGFRHGGFRIRKDVDMKKRKIDDLTFADAYFWKCLATYPDVSESIIASACGWSDALNIQFGSILNRLNELGDEKTLTALENAIRWYNAE